MVISELYQWASTMKVARSKAQVKTLKDEIDYFTRRLRIVVQEHLDIDQASRF